MFTRNVSYCILCVLLRQNCFADQCLGEEIILISVRNRKGSEIKTTRSLLLHNRVVFIFSCQRLMSLKRIMTDNFFRIFLLLSSRWSVKCLAIFRHQLLTFSSSYVWYISFPDFMLLLSLF